MPLLNALQMAGIKAVRAQAWTRTFTIKVYTANAITDYYDTQFQGNSPVTYLVDGDWEWRQQWAGKPSPGGLMAETDLILCCDVDHMAKLLQPGARILVEGKELSILAVSPYFESGEAVVQARELGQL